MGSSSLNTERNPTLSTIENNGPTTDATGAPIAAEDLAPLTACATPGPRQIRRLSSEQYKKTLQRVFGDDVPADAPVLRDPATLGYHVDADDSLIEDLDADALMGMAEEIATWAMENGRLDRFTNGCNNNDQNCQQNLIRNLGERISREPMTDERVNRFRALFDDETVETFQEGAAMVVSAMVQSPYMLYRRELGPLNRDSNNYQLTAFEVASELSYFLTNGPPDDALMQAAEQNRLASQADIDREAARLIATPEAAQVLGQFVRGWTDIDRLLTKAKEGADNFSPELRNDMLEETNRFFADVLENGTIGDLFGGQFTYMNKRLADFYGVQGPTGDNFERVDISDGRRVPGLLGQGSYLTAHALANNSSPVQRAFVVRERFLCNDLPEVPTNLDTNLKPQVDTDTSRERYGRHSSEEPCRSCHKLMDPIGFTFENYDGFGRFRETEAGKQVDSSGGVPIMEGKNLVQPEKTFPLTGVDELAGYLAQIEDVRACMINNLAYFGYGIANVNKWASSDKVCTDNFIRQEARDSGNTLKSALMGVLHAPHFTSRVRDL
ncbi:MAG TPA: DUF1592 domain-containing protein [Polyangiaceae bacterium]|nr:DUF1592 domain-containing protein [Polyangiaceae bacterium]